MKARAPGKLLLSGAYAVLQGAPAIVCALSRYAVADDALENSAPARELAMAFADAPIPCVDVSALYDPAGQKYGLGSSAAALVAALALHPTHRSTLSRDAVFGDAYRAHRAAQGGGSGVDVAASVYGGVLEYSLGEGGPRVVPKTLPEGLVWRIYFSGTSVRTSDFVSAVRALSVSNGARYHACMRSLLTASEDLARALSLSAAHFVASLHPSFEGLFRLGECAGVPIVTDPMRALSIAACAEGGAFVPSGAGGGDVCVWVGTRGPSVSWEESASEYGFSPVEAHLDWEGVTCPIPVQPGRESASAA